MSLYHDPAFDHQRPQLVPDLLGLPATISHHPLENQATTVLAWLADRSPVIGHSVLKLFLGEAPPKGAIGARTQLSLPKPGGGCLYPDLSICVADRALQLLVEVKVDSDFHVYPEFGDQLQPSVYRLLWNETPTTGARMRAVGTLTRNGTDVSPNPEALIARDVSWRDLQTALTGQIDAHAVEPEVRLVAESLVTAIDERIAPLPPSDQEQDAFFAANRVFLDRVVESLAVRLQAATPARAIRGDAYRGWRLKLLDANDTPLFLRVYLSAAASRLNLAGAPDVLIVAPERDANGTLEPSASVAAEAAGFPRTKDLDKFWLHRRLWPLENADADQVADEIAAGVVKMGLIASAANGLRPAQAQAR